MSKRVSVGIGLLFLTSVVHATGRWSIDAIPGTVHEGKALSMVVSPDGTPSLIGYTEDYSTRSESGHSSHDTDPADRSPERVRLQVYSRQAGGWASRTAYQSNSQIGAMDSVWGEDGRVHIAFMAPANGGWALNVVSGKDSNTWSSLKVLDDLHSDGSVGVSLRVGPNGVPQMLIFGNGLYMGVWDEGRVGRFTSYCVAQGTSGWTAAPVPLDRRDFFDAAVWDVRGHAHVFLNDFFQPPVYLNGAANWERIHFCCRTPEKPTFAVDLAGRPHVIGWIDEREGGQSNSGVTTFQIVEYAPAPELVDMAWDGKRWARKSLGACWPSKIPAEFDRAGHLYFCSVVGKDRESARYAVSNGATPEVIPGISRYAEILAFHIDGLGRAHILLAERSIGSAARLPIEKMVYAVWTPQG